MRGTQKQEGELFFGSEISDECGIKIGGVIKYYRSQNKWYKWEGTSRNEREPAEMRGTNQKWVGTRNKRELEMSGRDKMSGTKQKQEGEDFWFPRFPMSAELK